MANYFWDNTILFLKLQILPFQDDFEFLVMLLCVTWFTEVQLCIIFLHFAFFWFCSVQYFLMIFSVSFSELSTYHILFKDGLLYKLLISFV